MDRISELPDSILVHILTVLDAKDAVKTSSLSRKWRYLWMLLRLDLKFDQSNMFGSSNHNISKFDRDRGYHAFEQHRSEFFRRVDCYMNHMQQLHEMKALPRIRSLQVQFFLGVERPSSSRLNQWIQFAIEAGAEKVELLLSHEPYFLENFILTESNSYTFPLRLLSKTPATLKHLSLQRCSINSYCRDDFSLVRNLMILKLDNVYIGGHFLDGLFSNSLQLRELILHGCQINAEKLHVVSSSLVVLKIFHFSRGREIAISAPSLTSLMIGGNVPRLSSLEAPSLEKCSFTSLVTTDEFSLVASLPQLEDLVLDMGPLAVLTPMVEITPNSKDVSFASLKRLVVGFWFCECVDIAWFSTVLRAFPRLQKLQIMFPGDTVASKSFTSLSAWRVQNPPVEFAHDELKDVEISGWYGHSYEMEFALLLFRVAINLQRLKISPLMKFLEYKGQVVEWKNKDYSSWYSSKREILRGWLQSEVPDGVQFVLE